MAVPIWKDHYVDFGNVAEVQYEIRLIDGSIIFAGKSIRRPGEVSLYVKINDICADYLESLKMNDVNKYEGFISNDIATEFRVFDTAGTLIETVTFVNDWSYDHEKEDDGVLSSPINGIFDVRMPLLYSVSRSMEISVEARNALADFSIDFSSDFAVVPAVNEWVVVAENAGTLILRNIFNQNGGNVVINGSTKYVGLQSCATHALYYVNAYGGWDFLLMQGRSIEQDGYSRKRRKQEYDNRQIMNRGEVNYLNEVEKTFTLHTGWLVGDQGQRMHHLLGSTDVYLYDLDKQTMTPVVITDNECRYKTFGSEGMLIDYEIGVRVAHNIVRR